MNKEVEILIDEFILEVKKNFPEWLKDRKEETEDILFELRTHIYDSANEIEGSGSLNLIAVKKAINNMGTPKEIAKNYKKRGTPKYFISEELFEYYQRIVGIVLMIGIGLAIIVNVFFINQGNVVQGIISGISNGLAMFALFLVVITAIFVWLSSEGYLPEDFDKKKKQIPDSKQFKDQYKYYRPGAFLFSGIFGFIFGIFLLNDPLNFFHITAPDDLKLVIAVSGIITILQAVLNLMRIQSKDPGWHLPLNSFDLLLRFPSLALTIFIYINRQWLYEILPFIPEIIIYIFMIIAIVGTILDMITKAARLIKLYHFKVNYYNSTVRVYNAFNNNKIQEM